MSELSAKEFVKLWQKQNPNVIHIASEFEPQLMEAYAKYKIQSLEKKLEETTKERNDWFNDNAKLNGRNEELRQENQRLREFEKICKRTLKPTTDGAKINKLTKPKSG